MDERTCRILLGPAIAAALAAGNQTFLLTRKMLAGEICSSCKIALPGPNTLGKSDARAVQQNTMYT